MEFEERARAVFEVVGNLATAFLYRVGCNDMATAARSLVEDIRALLPEGDARGGEAG